MAPQSLLVLVSLLLAALPAASPSQPAMPPAPPASAAFGAPGVPAFGMYALSDLPEVDRAGEPTIGIPWDTDHLFFQAHTHTYKCVFANGTAPPQCEDVTPAFSLVNVDPMLHADPVSGRIYQGGLDGPCSLMGISDDDGASWLASRNMCSGHQFDHQSIGSGPWSTSAPETSVRDQVYPRATYYCSQGPLVGAIVVAVTPPSAACATSLDGGFDWQPFVEVGSPCGSFHGHIRVSEATGFAVLPFAICGDKVGYASTRDNGLTWPSSMFPDSKLGGTIGFDPSVGFSVKSGWMYYALANDRGMHVALSKDDGTTWETLGNGTPGVTPAKWLDLAPLYTDARTGKPLHFTTFTDVQAGDDDRVAITFLGTTDDGDSPFGCLKESAGLVWHYYLAESFDAGQSWAVARLSEDPVQVGGIFDGDPASGDGSCRNLLDFNDMDIDSHGRVHIGFADGCTASCATKYAAYAEGLGQKPKPEDSRGAHAAILRQLTGRGLFAKDDLNVTAPTTTGGEPSTAGGEEEAPVPGLSMLWAGAAVGVAALAASRRRR